MRRLARHLFTLCAAISLLLCVALCALWVRARHGTGDRISVLLSSGRHAVRFDPDRIRLVGPPRALPARQEALAWELAGQIRNRDLGWTLYGKYVNGVPVELGRVMDAFQLPSGASIAYGTPLARYQPDNNKPWASYPSLARPLTHALEDPDKWIIAHYLLWWEQPGHVRRVGDPLVRQGSVYVRDMGGLVVQLPVPGPDSPRLDFPGERKHFEWYYSQHGPNLSRIDPGQQVAIRNLWHDRLGVTLGTSPYWPFVLGSLVLPAYWTGRQYPRLMRARRVGLCPTCGYDLRASPERCPECGAAKLGAKGVA
jgi:hypothetical protein